MIKRIAFSLFAVMLCVAASATDWYGNKYSMFIHFGVYSSLGGVWQGVPVTRGYSEQIQACAGIYDDEYYAVASEFDPVQFDADAIVELARDAGMRSIVITSKHHDGFCMWDTATTDYSSVALAVCGRDFMKELSDACRRGGVNFGMYFSLIDWHDPYGNTMTTHNANSIVPEHHMLNLAQVRELCTKYGPVSELWFDMGAMTPDQSREMYELVHSLQPDCMVGGRLGNDMYDFSVMGDNSYPDGTLSIAWQSPASMFNETWGYRSWQKRCPVEEKVAEKLRNLIQVVSQGGNFLLNIGPDDKGAVVPYEAEVLRRMGAWLKQNGDVVYDTQASPFRQNFPWGAVTRKGNMLNMILSGEYPEGGIVNVPDPDRAGRTLSFRLSPDDYADPCDIKVIRHACRKPVEPVAPEYLRASETGELSPVNSVKDYTFTCQDYYTNTLGVKAYNWYVDGRSGNEMKLRFTASELGREVSLAVDSQTSQFVLSGTPVPSRTIEFVPADTTVTRARILEDYCLSCDLFADEEGEYLFELGSGNTIEVSVNGETVVSHLNPYRTLYAKEQILLHLRKGTNSVELRCFNRHEKTVHLSIAPSHEPLYEMSVALECNGNTHHVQLTSADRTSVQEDCKLHNVRLLPACCSGVRR